MYGILFIHWYVWVYYANISIGQLAWKLALHVPYNMTFTSNYSIIGYCMLGFIPVSAIVILPATLHWFLIESGQYNPYKLVYRITKFAHQHKIPVHRIAFTYSEDEVPSGLDLAKEKYGGKFTTEQVEDVKVFYGILKILFSFGAVFFLDFAALPMYALHTIPFYTGSDDLPAFNGTLVEDILLKGGLLSPLLIIVCSYSSVPVAAPPLHIPLRPWNAEKNGISNATNSPLFGGVIYHGYCSTHAA